MTRRWRDAAVYLEEKAEPHGRQRAAPAAVLRLTCGIAVVLGATIGSTPLGGATRAFTIDPAESRVLIEVGKSGALSFVAGHTHEVEGRSLRGTVEADLEAPEQSRIRLEIDASALRLTGKGDPPKDVPEVQRVMLSDQVLDVTRYRTITFQSTAVSLANRRPSALDLTVTGTLTLHGVSRTISAPVHVEIASDKLLAGGRFRLKQTDYGIKPVSVAGVVNVKDTLDIEFRIAARQ